MQVLSKDLLKPSLNWLLIFIPLVLALEHIVPDKPVIIFLFAALAIVPIASLIVKSTEQIAFRTGDAIGGLLNATFGNAPELIISFVALRSGFADMVRLFGWSHSNQSAPRIGLNLFPRGPALSYAGV